MSANLSATFYLISGILFILALRGLSSPETSRQKLFWNCRYGNCNYLTFLVSRKFWIWLYLCFSIFSNWWIYRCIYCIQDPDDRYARTSSWISQFSWFSRSICCNFSFFKSRNIQSWKYRKYKTCKFNRNVLGCCYRSYYIFWFQ